MILVLLGTQHNEFTRLLKEIEKNVENGIINEKVIVQAGFTKYKTDKMEIIDMISKDKLEELVDKASMIITHGGVGSIVMALNQNKKVIAVPRLHQYNEHVNDHQRQIIKVFDEKKYLIGIDEVEQLEEELKNINEFIPEKYISDNSKIINMIEDFIDNI